VSELRDDRVPPRGHDAQTLRQTIAMLDLVPQDAVFVEEDATVDILLRAAVFGGRRRSKPVTVVAPRQEEVALARAGHTVCVFPWAQTDLSLRGFAVEPAAARLGPSTALAGLAVITGTRPCADVGANWGPLPPTSGRVALSADAETTVGPVVMYFGGDGVAGPGPDRWPSRTLRGFRVATFDQRDAEQSRRLKGEAADLQLPAGDRVLAAPTVVRLTLHRTPRAPLAFAAILGAPFPLGTAKFEQGAAAVGRFTVCDAPAVPIAMLVHPE
jgi:hypothetical protein